MSRRRRLALMRQHVSGSLAAPHDAQRLGDRRRPAFVRPLRPAIDQIAGALENLDGERLRPLGRLRFMRRAMWLRWRRSRRYGRFLSTYPETQLELHVGDAPIDLVAEGFDAGIGPQDRAADGMIAVRVTGPMKMAVVGAPAYFAQWRAPRDPTNSFTIAAFNFVYPREAPPLRGHSCGMARRCEFRWMAGCGQRCDLACRAALDGLGIALTFETLAERSYVGSTGQGAGGLVARVRWIFCLFSGRRQVLPLCVPSLT